MYLVEEHQKRRTSSGWTGGRKGKREVGNLSFICGTLDLSQTFHQPTLLEGQGVVWNQAYVGTFLDPKMQSKLLPQAHCLVGHPFWGILSNSLVVYIQV